MSMTFDYFKKCVILFIVMVTVLFGAYFAPNRAFAAVTEPTNVLDDLGKDMNFNADVYPEVQDDNSIHLIQIAEGANKQLFVYIYQPSGSDSGIYARSINISRSSDPAKGIHNYKLQFINSSGVFYKYLVKDFTVAYTAKRYYNIISIFRSPVSSDIQPDNGTTITEISYKIGRQYVVNTEGSKRHYEVIDFEVIVVTDMFVGFCRYWNGFNLYYSACDSHFVAFNTDKPIDKLLEADVYYESQSYFWSVVPFMDKYEEYGEIESGETFLKANDSTIEYTGNGLFAPTFSWNRIETVDEFISENDFDNVVYTGTVININGTGYHLSDEEKQELRQYQWVLRFKETDIYMNSQPMNGTSYGESTLVGNVTILRLMFETGGRVYNLPAVSNKMTGSGEPVGAMSFGGADLTDYGKDLLRLIALILGIVLILIIVLTIGSAIGRLISFVQGFSQTRALKHIARNQEGSASDKKRGKKK